MLKDGALRVSGDSSNHGDAASIEDQGIHRAPFDWVLDAIDSLTPKQLLLAAARALGVRVISSMGAGELACVCGTCTSAISSVALAQPCSQPVEGGSFASSSMNYCLKDKRRGNVFHSCCHELKVSSSSSSSFLPCHACLVHKLSALYLSFVQVGAVTHREFTWAPYRLRKMTHLQQTCART